MENNEFKKVYIKNLLCYYFVDTVEIKDFVFDNVLIDEKSHENILVYGISYKTLIGPKPLQIRFNKADGYFRVNKENRYLELFGLEKHDVIYRRIRYLTSVKSGIIYAFCHYYSKINVNSYDSLPLEKILTLHYLLIVTKLVLDKISKSLLL